MEADDVVHRTGEGQRWKATAIAGVEYCGLRSHGADGGGSFLVRVARGARVPRHDHPGGEEIYVVGGRARIGGRPVKTGDYFWTPPGGAHDLVADEETLIFVNAPRGVVFLE
ncbi:MAG TPA: cupin domain-containing protein [Methylomirabilota bacterium]|nr:cupin domain-containing protein [Methylomirabilota bacterium]